MLPTGQMNDIWEFIPFWIGLLYVSFPLNFMVYGWNDMVDLEIDADNPRKDSYWFGAKGTQEQLSSLWKPILIVQLLFFPVIYYFIGLLAIPIFVAFFVVNSLYNLPKHGFRSKPPLELICQIGYLLIAPLSIYLNAATHLPWQTYLYLFLFALQSQLIGEVMDIEPDRKSGRSTSATVLGMKWAKLLIIFIVTVEVSLLFLIYKEFIFGGMLAVGLLWLIIDLAFVFKTKVYSMRQMKLFALMSNVVAVVSMGYVWWSGCLLSVG